MFCFGFLVHLLPYFRMDMNMKLIANFSTKGTKDSRKK